MIPDNIIERLNALDIVSVVQKEGVTLKKAGTEYEACCPFHSEKTPSFKISATKGIYKCFGCGKGGGPIRFVMDKRSMTFVEAAQHLCRSFNIDWSEEEPTAEEKQDRFERSQLFNANEEAFTFFFESYKKSDLAKQYATNRWSEETIATWGIGYAPSRNEFLAYAKAKGIGEQVLLDAGLIKRSENDGRLYDAFTSRLMFPIRNTTGNIIGFTGRLLNEQKDDKRPKYLNTATTKIFVKGDILFGSFEAQRVARTRETLNLVEGNPDVIRMYSVGQENTVAPLGTALTDNQIKHIKRLVKKVVIIGDNDDAGRKAVLRNGEALTRTGLYVRVMGLPDISNKKKTDPDEYFKAYPNDYDELLTNGSTIDFVEFYYQNCNNAGASQTEQLEVIKNICELLTYLPEEELARMYIAKFSAAAKQQKLWNECYYKAKTNKNILADKDEQTDRMKVQSEYGFYAKDNCYFGKSVKAKGDVMYSNFILKPRLHIKDDQNARRIYEMVNNRGNSTIIKLSQEDMVSLTAFKTRTESKGNYIWEVGADELTRVKKYLFNDTPSADEIKQLGWQKRHGFYAWGNGIVNGTDFIPCNPFGVVQVDEQLFYLPGCAKDNEDNFNAYPFQRKFVYVKQQDITISEYAQWLVTLFGDNAKVAFAFYIATLFADIIRIITPFPILNLFGPKGTGKSELAKALVAAFMTKPKAANIVTTTISALGEAIAEVSNGLVHIDEYKNTIEAKKIEFLKGLWDETGRTKMDMDNNKTKITTNVDCGTIVTGQEMMTADNALLSRIVLLSFDRATRTEEERKNYDAFMLVRGRGFCHITNQILFLRNKFEGTYRENYEKTLEDFQSQMSLLACEDRILRNWVAIIAAFRTVEPHFHLPFDYKNLLQIASTLCAEQNAKVVGNNELAGFWEAVETLVSYSKIVIGADYKIKGGDTTNKEVKMRDGRKYIFLRFKQVADIYLTHMRAIGENSIPKGSLRFYLERSAEFVGSVSSERFLQRLSTNGNVSENINVGKQQVTSAWVFDYDALTARYGISIDVEDITMPNIETEQPISHVYEEAF